VTALLDEVWHDHWGRLLALLVAQYRRLDLAEDALADAFEAAARTWGDEPPGNPPAWLLTTARRKAVDRLRAEAIAARKQPLLVVDARTQEEAERHMADPGEPVLDERLRLVLMCAHPSLAPESAAALTLRLVLGVATDDIARLFLVPRATMAARLTRARKKLAATGVPFAVPGPDDLAARVPVVAHVAYLAFTAGYAPTSGDQPLRADLAGEAVRLVRVVREVLPRGPVLDALLALVLLQHSRRDARVAPDGGLVLLPDQDRSRWRHDEIAEALALLTPWVADAPARTPYLLEALIAAEHAVAPTADDTAWPRIAELYAELEAVTGSPVVRLNRAVAVAEADGPLAGLALLDGLGLPGNHRLPSVRAELLARAGRDDEARAAYDEALALCGNDVERQHLAARRSALEGGA
jgi:RNA polymerase sigma-70 factor (ECF subfamily)